MPDAEPQLEETVPIEEPKTEELAAIDISQLEGSPEGKKVPPETVAAAGEEEEEIDIAEFFAPEEEPVAVEETPVGETAVKMEATRRRILGFGWAADQAKINLAEIIKQLKIIYKKANMIHGDLGEFNIVLDEKGNILIIDWLQWIPIDHPNAISILERDITNICTYFRKKFKIESNIDKILNLFYIK